jgi:hypothetical protein
MLDRKYRKSYRMSYLAFDHLILELNHFLRLTADMFVRPPLPIRKHVSLVVYRLAQGLSCKAMDSLYGCGESTIRKYTLIICKVFSSADGLFGRYIHAPTGHRLTDTIRKICKKTGLPNVVGVIDGTHIPLSFKPARDLTPMPCDFFNRENFIVCCYRLCAIRRGFSGMFVHDNMEAYMTLRNLHGQGLTRNYEDETYCRNQFWRSVQLKFGHICWEIQHT